MNRHIVHITSVHSRRDTRIFIKQCRGLARAGYRVTLVVADGLGDEDREGVGIVDVGTPQSRLSRMSLTTRRVQERALRLDADLYHLHDPELLPAGVYLKARGKRVVFDAHEDLPLQLLSKPYLWSWARAPMARTARWFEHWACARLDGVVAATPSILEKFIAAGIPAIAVCNFPIVGELEPAGEANTAKDSVCYVGGLSEIRGIRQLVEAMALCTSPVRLNLCGRFVDPTLHAAMRSEPGWRKVSEFGFVSRDGIREVMSHAVAGVVNFLPEPNHISAQPNKLFEYMSAGVAVIASDFPAWREIIVGNECGFCVNPSNPAEISEKIDRLINDQSLSKKFGQNGLRVVRNKYNWLNEESKLIKFYSRLIDHRH